MDRLKWFIEKLSSNRVERLFMSATSGFMVCQFFEFVNIITDYIKVSILSLFVMFICYCIGIYFIRNLRHYFLKDRYDLAMFFIGSTGYFLLYKMLL